MTALLDESYDQTGAEVPLRPVRFDQTIPRHLVHRAAVSEVFLTDLRVIGENRFQVGAQWPRRHSFFGPRTKNSHDPMLYVETCRQAEILIAHSVFDVPLDYGFLGHRKTFSVSSAGLRTCNRPVDVVLNVTVDDIRYRGGKPGGMRVDYECFRDGRRIGTLTDTLSWVAPATYRRLRGEHFAATPFQATLLPTVEPALVGRERPEDVLVAETPLHNVWALQFDPDHPVLFDHPTDHVPGMLMVEGARQAALLMVGHPGALPLRAEFDFASYVEFDAPCLIVADEDPPARDGLKVISVTFQQNGATAATGTLEMLVP